MLLISTNFFTVQSRLKIANNPNVDATSFHCSAGYCDDEDELVQV